MPLIIISGFPASGKSTRAKALHDFFLTKNKKVNLISENEAVPKAGFLKNEYFADSQKEKQVRSDMKSDALRFLNNKDVVILDAGNYIKGFRYELFCATKTARTTQLTIFCGISFDQAWKFNEQRNGTDQNLTNTVDKMVLNNSEIPYTKEIFDQLCMRFEEPHGNCRWDKPLFVLFPDDELNEIYLENIYSALFETAPLPPNKSTENPPLSSTNYLFDLDQLTQKIVAHILSLRKVGIGGAVTIEGSQIKAEVPDNINAIQLNRLRRQFINFAKINHATTSTLDKIPQLFVQFLNSHYVNAR